MTPDDVFVLLSTGLMFVIVGMFMAGVAPAVTNAFKVGILFTVVGAGLISVGMSIDEAAKAAAEPTIANWASGPGAAPAPERPTELGSGGATSHERSTEIGRAPTAPPAQLSPECYENKSIKPVDPNSDL